MVMAVAFLARPVGYVAGIVAPAVHTYVELVLWNEPCDGE
jgi:hypothetical protein